MRKIRIFQYFLWLICAAVFPNCKTVHETLIVPQAGNEYVLEAKGGLYWSNQYNNAKPVTFPEATALCNTLKAGGKRWRLPTLEETFRTFATHCDRLEESFLMEFSPNRAQHVTYFNPKKAAKCIYEEKRNLNTTLPVTREKPPVSENTRFEGIYIWTSTPKVIYFDLSAKDGSGAINPASWAKEKDKHIEYFVFLESSLGSAIEYYSNDSLKKDGANVICVANE